MSKIVSCAASLLFIAIQACSSSQQASTTTSSNDTQGSSGDSEPETAPVVAAQPRFLDVQRNVIRLRRGIRIQFATGSDEISPESNEILDEVASVMQQNQRIRIRVEGHTDDVGNDADNQSLSDRRAASVQRYLVAHGITAERVESTGCGETAPMADTSEDGRQQNRRVEFVILRRRRVVDRCQIYRPGEASGAPSASPAAQ